MKLCPKSVVILTLKLYFVFTLSASVTITVSGAGSYISDSTGTSNLGTSATYDGSTILYITAGIGDFVISINSKYNIMGFGSSSSSLLFLVLNPGATTWYFNNLGLSAFKYSPITIFAIDHVGGNDSIDNLAGKSITRINFSADTATAGSNNIYGDVKNLTAGSTFNLVNIQNFPNITGSLSAFSGKAVTGTFTIKNTGITGKIDNLSGVATGTIIIDNNNLDGGDFAKLNKSVYAVSSIGNPNAQYTYSGFTNGRTNILALSGPLTFTAGLDQYLIDNAALTLSASATATWQKQIQVKGNRTSASDAAVATLVSKGVTVSVTPIS